MFTDILRVARLLVPTLAFLITPTSEKSSMSTKAISKETMAGLSLGAGSVVMVKETFDFFSDKMFRTKFPSSSLTNSFLESLPVFKSTMTFTGPEEPISSQGIFA